MNQSDDNIRYLKNIFIQYKIFENYDLKKIGVFGSFARGEEANDIDLLISEIENLEKAYKLKMDLERITNRKIDLIVEKFANPIILHRARKDMKYVTTD